MNRYENDPVLQHANFRQRARLFAADHLHVGSIFTYLAVQAEIGDVLRPESADPNVSPNALLDFHEKVFAARSSGEQYKLLAQPVADSDPTDRRVWFDVIEGLTNHDINLAVTQTAHDLLPQDQTTWHHVADLGTGTGELGRLLKSEDGNDIIAGKITYIDRVPEMLAVAKERTGAQSSFVSGDVLQLPFADESFDLMVSGGLVYSLGPDLQNGYFGEISRLLKPGGVYIVGDQYKWRHETNNLGRSTLSWLIKGAVSGPEIAGNPLAGVDQESYFSQFGFDYSAVDFGNQDPSSQSPLLVRVLKKTGAIQPNIPSLPNPFDQLYPDITS